MSCSHLVGAKLTPPRVSDQVHKEECTLCFDNQDSSSGILVCASCFNGSCLSPDRDHAQIHFERTGHAIGLVIKRTRKSKAAGERDDNPPPLKKLAIVLPADEEVYTYETEWRCFLCPGGGQRGVEIEVGEGEEADKLAALKISIMTHLSSATQSEVKAWEEEIEACEHTLTVEQWEGGGVIGEGGQVSQTCAVCDLGSNLWLCLTCGMVNCGRKQFGGIGGNGHALDHFQEMGHPVGVKLGTITPEGGGDVYCYTCNDARIDPEMAAHLKTFGIEIMGQTKTEKSMTELQIEHNLKFDFSMTGEDGKELQPVCGPGLTGLKNLGNSCYMASVLQSIFALPAFRKRYATASEQHFQNCMVPLPADCLECQMYKMADGLTSGRYSHPATAPPPPTTVTESPFSPASGPHFQEGIRPAMFKELVGKGHAEFSTMRQQDSEEFLQHLLDRLREEAERNGLPAAAEATQTFRFALEQRLMCTECKRVSYKAEQTDTASLPVPVKEKEVVLDATDDGAAVPAKQYEAVPLTRCIQGLVADEALEYTCPECKKGVLAVKSTRFKTFPETLILHMRKFQLVNWLPTKIDVPIDVPETLTLDAYAGKGHTEGEVLFEEEQAAPQVPDFNAAAMSQLEGMGFPTIRCQKALLATGNADAEAAMNWLFAHMEDPDIDVPLQQTKQATGKGSDEAQVAMLADMGFTSGQAKKALRETDGNAERAVEWLFSHPDDTGEDALGSTAAANVVSSNTLPGSTATPAKYRLKAFISHKGPSVHSGHYVATIRGTEAGSEDWVLFNDERVVKADATGSSGLMSQAYLYIYERL